MNLLCKKMPLFLAILLATPLVAQDTIPLPREVIVINGDSIFIEINHNYDGVSTDRLVEVFEALQASLDSAVVAWRDCDRCGEEEGASSTTNVAVSVVSNVAVVVALLLIARAIRNRPPAVQQVDVHEHQDPPKKDLPPHDSEEGGP